MRSGIGLDGAMGQLRGAVAVAGSFGEQGEIAGGGRVVGVHRQRLAEGFGVGEGAGCHLGGKLAAKLVDGFGGKDHWAGARRR